MGKKAKANIRSWKIETKLNDFNRIRYDLIKNNFVFLRVAEQLKLNLNIQLSKNRLIELGRNPYDQKFITILTPFRRVSTMLHIDWMFLFSFIFHIEPGVRDYHEIIVATELKEYLLEPGLYVRFHPWMTQDDWLNELEKVKYMAKTMTQVSPVVTLYPEVEAEEFFMEKQKHHVSKKDIEENIQTYLSIESRIAFYLKERDEGLIIDESLTRKDDNKESGVSIIDRILEDLISEIESEVDTELDKIKQAKKNAYYEVASRYALPTFRELPKYLKQIG